LNKKGKITSTKWEIVVLIAVAVVIIAIFLVNLPDLMGKPLLTWNEKTNIVLTFVIAMFAVLNGYSAYSRVNIEKKKYAVESASNELEKAYGPIYTILSKPVKQDESTIELLVSEKLLLDEKLSIYRCMFPANITDYWEKNIRKIEPSLSTDSLAGAKDLMHGTYSLASGMIDVYKIPLEFVEMFTAEYKKRIKNQQELLTKLAI
jgi:hypothetical protein